MASSSRTSLTRRFWQSLFCKEKKEESSNEPVTQNDIWIHTREYPISLFSYDTSYIVSVTQEIFDAQSDLYAKTEQVADDDSTTKGMDLSNSRKINRSSRSGSDESMDSNSLTRDTRCYVDELPMEMLLKIMKYLQNSARKTARLVCRKWYQACCQSHRSEKFVFYGLYDKSHIMQLLATCGRDYLNLDFCEVELTQFPVSFWVEFGPKIYSLKITDCALNNEVIKNLVLNCYNLSHLSLIYDIRQPDGLLWGLVDVSIETAYLQQMTMACSCSLLRNSKALEHLVKTGIIREKLISLEINLVDSSWISNRTLHQLFVVFPNVINLSIHFQVLENPFECALLRQCCLPISHLLTLDTVMNKLALSGEKMEKLKISFGNGDSTSVYNTNSLIISATNLHRLKEVEINKLYHPFPLMEEKLFNFLSTHVHLESIKYSACTGEFMTNSLMCLLDTCPNLHHLDISTHDKIFLTLPQFGKLATSALETFKIDAQEIHIEKKSRWIFRDEDEYVIPTNNKLRSLSLKYSPWDWKDYPSESAKVFLTTFRNLRHLEIVNSTDEILQYIWINQIKLRSLKLFGCENCSKKSFIGNSVNSHYNSSFASSFIYSMEYVGIKRLKKLEHLYVGQIPGLTKKEYSELFSLPNLKYLHVVNLNWRFVDAFPALQNLSSLEGLRVYWPNSHHSLDLWTDMSPLKNLRYLHITDNTSARKEPATTHLVQHKSHIQLAEEIFLNCPSLRALKHNLHSFYYDVVSKKVTEKMSECKYHVAADKIDTFSVDWLEY